MIRSLLLLFCLSSLSPGIARGEPLGGGNFEGPFKAVTMPADSKGKISGEIADGWRDESAWGDVTISYGRDAGRNGGSSQKIDVTAKGGGSPQFAGEIPLVDGATYRLTAWVKAAAAGEASLMLRKGGTPYTTYGVTKIALTNDWRKVEVNGVVNESDDGLVMFLPQGTGTFWIDDVTLEQVAGPPPGLKDSVHLVNGDFEGGYQTREKQAGDVGAVTGEIADGWKDDSAWGEVSVVYGNDGNVNHTGKSAQRIEVKSIEKGGVQFCQDVKLKKGRIYRFSMRLRALIFCHADISLRQSGPPYENFGVNHIPVSPEWRKFEVFARMTKNSDALALFCPGEPTAYWIDDAEVEDVTDAVGGDGKLVKGNLWTDGSFEAGLGEGWMVRMTGFENNVAAAENEHLESKALIDPSTAADGKSSLEITANRWTAGLLYSPQIPPKFSQSYTASVALRCDQPRGVSLVLGGTTAAVDVEVGTEWKRYSVSGPALLGTPVGLQIRCIQREGPQAKFWVDAAMLEEGKQASAAYIAPFPVELAMTLDRPGSIVFDGEAAPLNLLTAGEIPKGAKLKWSVENLAGKVTELPSLPLPASVFNLKPDPGAPLGVFKIRAEVVDAGGKAISGKMQKIFARLPKPRDLTEAQAEKSYFGAHVELQPEKLAIARATGHRWVRMHDASNVTQWPIVEAKPGEWNWNFEGLKNAKKAGLNVLGLLAGAPARVSLKPQANAGYFASWNVPDAPGAIDQWAAYVKKAVVEFRPYISCWEIWNEPYINGPNEAFFPSGKPEQYGELLKRASLAIRETDPKATIVGVCSSGTDYPWLERVLGVAGTQYFDEMSFHGYGNRLQGGVKSQIGDIIDQLNGVQSRHGTPKPIWNTEGGPTDNSSWYAADRTAASMQFQMATMVRLDVAQIAAGVRKFFPYSMTSYAAHGEGEHSMLEYDRSPKPITAARAMLASRIDGATYAGRTEPAAGVEAHAFKQPDGSTVRVVWSFDGGTHPIGIPMDAKALDVVGNPIKGKTVNAGEAPVYFISSK